MLSLSDGGQLLASYYANNRELTAITKSCFSPVASHRLLIFSFSIPDILFVILLFPSPLFSPASFLIVFLLFSFFWQLPAMIDQLLQRSMCRMSCRRLSIHELRRSGRHVLLFSASIDKIKWEGLQRSVPEVTFLSFFSPCFLFLYLIPCIFIWFLPSSSQLSLKWLLPFYYYHVNTTHWDSSFFSPQNGRRTFSFQLLFLFAYIFSFAYTSMTLWYNL